jgi:hypothetical protein
MINEFNLGIYFRTWDDLWPLERKLINMSYGNILDIGSCTGYYIPFLMEKGSTTGIEVNQRINNISRKNGNTNCFIGDIFTYDFKSKFDTIILMGNDIALSGTLYNTKKLLKKLKELLNNNGQILLINTHVRSLKYWHVVFTPRYNGQFGIPAKYLFFNTSYFRKFALKYGFLTTVLGKEEHGGIPSHLLKLVKIS